MSTPVYMPVLGMTMEEGTIGAWLKAEGDPVEQDELLLTVETDKTSMDVPSPATGVLLKILVPAGDTVPVRTPIAHIGDPGEEVLAEPARAGAPTIAPPSSSPRARRVAAEHSLTLDEVRPSAPDGRITENDVMRVVRERAAAAGASAAAGGEAEPLSRVRRLTAERMQESARTVARVTLFLEADLQEAAEFREQLGRSSLPDRIDVPWDALLIRAVGLALVEHPLLRAQWIEGRGIRVFPTAHVAIAIALEPQGLVAPVVRDADRRPLREIAVDLAEKVERARAGRLRPEDLEGAVFTITNLGAYGVEAFTPIVDLPQGAILGVGRIAPKARVREGELLARISCTLSLSFDHRVLDGAPAAAFLRRLAELLERPPLLWAV